MVVHADGSGRLAKLKILSGKNLNRQELPIGKILFTSKVFFTGKNAQPARYLNRQDFLTSKIILTGKIFLAGKIFLKGNISNTVGRKRRPEATEEVSLVAR